MADVEEDGVEEHKCCLEEPEPPLVPNEDRDIRLWRVGSGIEVGDEEVFDCAEDGAHCNQKARCVKRDENVLDVRRTGVVLENPGFATEVIIASSQGKLDTHHDKLEDECGLKEGLAGFDIVFVICSDRSCSSIARECFNNRT